LVYYSGDTTIPLRTWKILEFSPSFATIQQSVDPSRPDDPQEIKVVRHNPQFSEIYRPLANDDMYQPMSQQPVMMNQTPMYVPMPEQPVFGEPDTTSKINFNPIINVVAGDNKGNIDFTKPAIASVDKSGEVTKELPAVVESEPKTFNNMVESSGEPINFGKLIVVKKE
jgi:hypothetical protein